MTVGEIAKTLSLDILADGDALTREIQSVYSCDLLSFVMGRAPADSAWVTVMGNVNAVAVALLADTACVVLAEDAALDEQAKTKAQANGVAVLHSTRAVFDTALDIHRLITGEMP